MALTASTMLPLGTIAPDFELPDCVSEKKVSLQSLKSSIATVIVFMCNHCPFVKHIQRQLVDVANHYQAKGIQFIAINSNDTDQYPDDSPEEMIKISKMLAYPFPYLFDETQKIAKAYQAACTPDFYIFDAKLRCVYRGQFDDSRPGNNIPVTGKDLTEALDQILARNPVSENQKPSLGCNIKWRNDDV